MKLVLAATAVAFIAAIPSASLSQQTESSMSPSSIFSTQTTVVMVPALVRDKTGNPVFTLSAKDFVLTDNGVPQALTLDADSGAEPIALVVVLEVGGAGARELDKLSSLAPMLDSVIGNVPHRIAVIAFAGAPVLVKGFTAHTEDAASILSDLTSACAGHRQAEQCLVSETPIPHDNGAAILDSLSFAVGLLRAQPAGFRRGILLISETLDRGSHVALENAVRALSESNTSIYAVAFSTAKSEAAHYAYHTLPIQPGWVLSNKYPNPPHGCMGADPDPDPDGPHNRLSRVYDCLVQLAPPLGLAKMAAIATADALQRNVPQTVAHLTGGEYFKLTDSRSLESSLASIANHIPNRYVLSFHPQSPHPGLHVITLRVPGYDNLAVSARRAYWAEPELTPVQAVSQSH